MASQVPIVRVRGLWSNPNPFSEVPQGALTIASNVVVDRDSIAESRRGFKQYGDPLADVTKYLSFEDTLLAHTDDTLYHDVAGTLTAYTGTIEEASGKLRSAKLSESLYLTTAAGIYRLDDVDSDPIRAGVGRALDGTAVTDAAGGFLPNGSSVAYRIIWGYKNENNRLILGAPSARIICRNSSGGAKDVDLEFTVIPEATEDYFYQVYRSESVASLTAQPSELMQLVFQKNVSAAQITAGVVTMTDVMTDDQKGAFIYTAPTQDGPLKENIRPPFANDICEFRGHLFYANTSLPHKVVLKMIENFVIADTVEVDGETYTATAAENIAADQFEVFASLTDTMRSLIRVINRSASTTTVNAFEIDEASFFIETRLTPGTQFEFDCSNDDVFSQPVPLDSDSEAVVNRVYVSKPLEGDAVPLVFSFDVGAGTEPIKRILSVRDAVFVLKTDGVYRITGTDLDNFVVEPHDTTVIINGPETAVVLDNQVYFMSDRGIVAISVTGLNDTIGRPIEVDLLRLGELVNFSDVAWAVNYDNARRYILATPTLFDDTVANKIWVYNYFTKAWTNWDLEGPTATVVQNKLFFHRASDDQPLKERKDFLDSDFADDEYDVTITTATGDEVTVVSVPSGVEVGMTLIQGLNQAIITDITGLVLTVSISTLTWAAAAAKVYTPIPVEIETIKDSQGTPGLVKYFPETELLFEDANFESVTGSFSTDFSQGSYVVDIISKNGAAWGLFSWGEEEWGGSLGGDQAIRVFNPREASMGHWLRLNLRLEEAYTSLSYSGYVANVVPMSERTRL